MSKEIQVRKTLIVSKGALQYQTPSQLTQFTNDMSGTLGDTPGLVLATVLHGTDVDLSQLTNPGICEIINLDATNFVEVGIWDPALERFYAPIEVGPGESYVVKLNRFLGRVYGTGSGTGNVDSGERLRIRADTAPCSVQVHAFDR